VTQLAEVILLLVTSFGTLKLKGRNKVSVVSILMKLKLTLGSIK